MDEVVNCHLFIHIADNDLGDAGINLLCRSLQDNFMIRVLSLSSKS